MISTSNEGKAAITEKYLGVDKLSDGVNPLVYQQSQTVSALPFLAYQKIYFDFFSDSKWEKHKGQAYIEMYDTGKDRVNYRRSPEYEKKMRGEELTGQEQRKCVLYFGPTAVGKTSKVKLEVMGRLKHYRV